VTAGGGAKVLVSSCESDHNRALYRRGLAGFQVQGLRSCLPIRQADDLLAALKGTQVLHVTWAEYLFEPRGFEDPEYFPRLDAFLAQLRDLPVRIAWTQHNRRPHHWPEQAGRALYARWAAVADLALHHSAWGRDLLLKEYAYHPDCGHPVLLVPDLAPLMPGTQDRPALERLHGLPPAPIRLGILGRHQEEKQVELMLQAFVQAGRRDQQLVVTAYVPGMRVPRDLRIFLLPRRPWMDRGDIAGHLALCDGLVAAQTGGSYLTSGLLMDALAGPTAVIVPRWGYYEEMLGPAAVYHGNDLASLTAALAGLDPPRLQDVREAMIALRPRHATERLAGQLSEAFLACLEDPPASPGVPPERAAPAPVAPRP
jgi:hypothetical protein